MHEGFSVSGAPFLDLVSQTPRPRGRGKPMFAEHQRVSNTTLADATLACSALTPLELAKFDCLPTWCLQSMKASQTERDIAPAHEEQAQHYHHYYYHYYCRCYYHCCYHHNNLLLIEIDDDNDDDDDDDDY